MAVSSINAQNSTIGGFSTSRKNISYGYIDVSKQKAQEANNKKDRILAGIGSTSAVALTAVGIMKAQEVKNPFHIKYSVPVMLSIAAAGNIGGVLLSSIGETKSDKKKKWKEGAFQMMLTAAPMLLVDGALSLCAKTKKFNNNFCKIVASCVGVAIGSNSALYVSNKLRSDKEAKKPKRELKLIDMIANLDDAVAILVLAKIPFADKIHIERALPFIYSFCGYRSGSADVKHK